MNIAEKLQTIEENVPKVYESGYNEGYEAGKAEGGGSGEVLTTSGRAENACATGGDYDSGNTLRNWYVSADGYILYRYELKGAKKLKITGAVLHNSNSSGTVRENILFVNGLASGSNAIGVINSTDMVTEPVTYDASNPPSEYIVTVPQGLGVEGVYISCINGSGDPVVEVIESVPSSEAYDEGYDKGHDEGKAEGVAQYTDVFWDTFQQGGNKTEYENAFSRWEQCMRRNIFRPKYSMRPTMSCKSMFTGFNYFETDPAYIPDLVDYFDQLGIELDFSQVTGTFDWLFHQAVVKRIGRLDFSNTSEPWAATCGQNPYLVTVGPLVVNENSKFAQVFANCKALENVTFEGTIGQNTLAFNACPLLSDASLANIIEHLKDYSNDESGSHKIVFGAANVAKLSETQKQTIQDKGWSFS